MSFRDYSNDPAANTSIGEGIYIGPDMARNDVRPALQQLAADGKEVFDVLLDTGDPIPSGLARAASRAALAAITGQAAGMTRYLSESGREGVFTFDSSDLSALVAADTRQAVYVAPAATPTGASGAWKRERDDDHLHIDWFGPNADGATDDTASFVALRTLAGALATGAASGVRQGPEIKLGRAAYYLASSFDCKGFCAKWVGNGGGFETWNNTGGTVIKMASGASFIIQRADTEGASTGTTIPYGADGSTFYDITFMGSGQGVGSAPVVWLRANSIRFYDCRWIEGGSHGLQVKATSGGGGALEGNANCWLVVGGSASKNGGSGIFTVGADANAGRSYGTSCSGNTRYGVEDTSFLGNLYDGLHCDGNTLGHINSVGATNRTRFSGYFESGYPNCTISALSDAEAISGVNPVGTGAVRYTTNSLNGFNGLGLSRTGGGNTIDLRINADATNGNLLEVYSSTGYSGAAPRWIVQGENVFTWLGYGANDFDSIWTGSGNTAYKFGRASATYGSHGFKHLVVGDESTDMTKWRHLSYGAAVPGSGDRSAGEIVFNNAPTQGGILGWSCYTSGAPGSWTANYINARADPAIGVGYVTGAGGTVTQATNKATGVTLNKVCGQITLNAAALAAATIVSFTLTNSAIAAGDVLVLNHISGGTGGAYTLNAQSAAGSAVINVRNNTAGSLSEAIVIAFAVVKATTT